MTKRDLPAATMLTRLGVRSGIADEALAKWNPDVRAAVQDDNTISILDPIGADDGWGDAVSSKRVVAALRSIGDRDVVVNINSPGGDFFEGLAIYNALRKHPGAVTVNVLGMAASAGAVIAMAGDDIRIGRAAFMMIHNTWVVAVGNQHTLLEISERLKPFDAAAAKIFVARTGLDESEIVAMLDDETYLGGEAAVAQGFADGFLSSDEVEGSVTNAVDMTPMAARKRLDTFAAKGGLSKKERRKAFGALDGGTSRAAPSGTSRAAVESQVNGWLVKLGNLSAGE